MTDKNLPNNLLLSDRDSNADGLSKVHVGIKDEKSYTNAMLRVKAYRRFQGRS